ncbi:MAG: MBL fold metallo-hydrolase [Methanobacterium sp.]|uniref:MBL fold metallo-hydrolase n=2 Tax=Methanobacterium sp. TaxID=2164 RepID=UPI003C77B6F1
MKIAENVEMLEISMNMLGVESKIFPTLIWDDNNMILVDAGLPGAIKTIEDEVTRTGLSFDKIDQIIVTHTDIDHIGGIQDIQNELEHPVIVMAHKDDKPFIEGEKKFNKTTPERMAQLQEKIMSMPEDQRKPLLDMFQNPPKSKVDKVLEDGTELPCCGGIIVIHTPGHTPGHICLYLKKDKILIAGDLLHIVDGELRGPYPHNTPDMEAAVDSIKKFSKYDIEKIVCYHSGLYTSTPNQKLAELAEK